MTTDTTPAFDRYIALDGTPNFRDYGGYQCADGRRIKWRRLFRSGQLSSLTARDLTAFESLDIQLVFDFRREQECDKDPSRFPESALPKVVGLPITPGSSGGFLEQLASGELSGEEMANFMCAINRELALEHAQCFKDMFSHLLDQNQGASLVHCAAGKDRTGFAVAMMLAALGVSRETIFADYMLTARYFNIDAEIERIGKKYQWKGSLDAIRPMLEVREDYLHSAFVAIDEEFSSLDEYLAEVLGLGSIEREQLQDRYLV